MYILKNAWKNIIRNKGRNILIGIIVLVISCACSITLAIRSSASSIVKSYEEKNPIEATIGMNRESLMNSLKDEESSEDMINTFNDMESITIDEINNYGDSKYVKSYYYTYKLGINAEDIDEATDSLVKETTETNTTTTITEFGGNMPGMPGGGSSGNKTQKSTTTHKTEKIYNEKAQNGAFTLIGYSSYESMSEFINGEYTISDGSVSDDFESNNCVISEELATLNDLSVGDTITLVNPNDEDKTYEIVITGIFTESSENSTDMSQMFTNSANYIITNINFINTILNDDEDLEPTITPTFIIKDEDSIEPFQEEVSEKGLSEYYEITTNIDEIESATEVVNNVKTFASTFLIITLIIGGVVLVVINMINIRERKYEIGVLRTIGMKKKTLSCQFMVELLIVSMSFLLLGSAIGACLSVPVSNLLLENEIESTSSKYDDISKNFGRDNMDKPDNVENDSESTDETTEETTEETNSDTNKKISDEDFNKMDFGVASVSEVDSIDAVVDFKVLGELLLIGILLTLLSSLASMISIARFSPLTILKERS